MSIGCISLLSAEHMQVIDQPMTQQELFRIVADRLVREGYAREDYFEQLENREKVYPTGLPMPKCGVAIPHVNHEFVKRSTIYVSLLKKPADWHSMEDPSVILPVSLVFNICLAEMEKQTQVLSDIISLIQQSDLLEELLKCSTPEEMMAQIRKEAER